MPRLVLLSEGLTGRTYELKGDKTTVGRVSDNAFEIPEASVSSHHCELLLRGNELLVKDLGSTNGTFINGDKIEEGVLKPGQILRVGMIEMQLETGDPAAPAAAAAAASAASSKKNLEQTRVIPQGIKLDELEGSRPLVFDSKAGFERKTNRGTRIFIIAAALVGVALVVVLILVLMRSSPGQ
jgi:pSer/pThr/pTyr-binding forkhead associated (FHA) protein